MDRGEDILNQDLNPPPHTHTHTTPTNHNNKQSWLADADGHLDDKRRLLAGLGAGVTEAILIVTPFDVVKIRLQEQHGLDKVKAYHEQQVYKFCGSCVAPPAHHRIGAGSTKLTR